LTGSDGGGCSIGGSDVGSVGGSVGGSAGGSIGSVSGSVGGSVSGVGKSEGVESRKKVLPRSTTATLSSKGVASEVPVKMAGEVAVAGAVAIVKLERAAFDGGSEESVASTDLSEGLRQRVVSTKPEVVAGPSCKVVTSAPPPLLEKVEVTADSPDPQSKTEKTE
jgi:hypothetical protein